MSSPVPEPVLYGVIGGSGVYKMEGLEDPKEYAISTPFGDPSDKITVAKVHGVYCAFLPRHNRHHYYTPTEVNYRANIYALKILGVKYLLSITATGSLQDHMRPGDMVVVDQLIDKSYARESTFFGNGCVAHAVFAHPTCALFNQRAFEAIQAALPAVKVHPKGCLVTMEGPAFSTKAESLLNKQSGGDLIGMTTATESKLAREAEMAHCVIAMVTDMDAWSDEPHVDVSVVIATLTRNGNNAQIFTKAIIGELAKEQFVSEAHSALAVAIMTPKDCIPIGTKLRLQALIGKYVNCA
jgi:5'-methylthioadenosine phosphorylase